MKNRFLLFLFLLITGSAWAQAPTRLIYSQQSGSSANDQVLTAELSGDFPVTGITRLSDATQFTQPNDLAFDPVNNYLFVIDNASNTGILRYTYARGSGALSNRTVVVAGTTSATYQGIALDAANGRLYFTQSSTTSTLDAIKVVEGVNAGTISAPITPTELTSGSSGSFNNLNDIVYDAANRQLYVADAVNAAGGILRYTLNTNGVSISGSPTSLIGGTGVSGLTYTGLALDMANNRLYFTQSIAGSTSTADDAVKYLSTLSPFTVTSLVTGSGSNFYAPSDLTIDLAGQYLYVADQGNPGTNSILRFQLDGTAATAQATLTTVVPSSTAGAYSGVALDGGFTAAATSVRSITRVNLSPTNAGSVQYTVTFAASVTDLAASNFNLTTNGSFTTAPSVSNISGSGTTYTVTVNTGSGDGTLRLNLNNATGLTPSVSNVPYTSGETYTVDKTAPTTTISSSAGTSGSTTGTTPIPFAVTFPEAVTGFFVGDVTVTGGTVSGFSGSGTTYTFNVTPTNSGNTVTVNVAANTAQDAAGNGNSAASPFSITARPNIVLSPTTLPSGTVGVAYSQAIIASGGIAPYSYAITAGALPAGLTLSSAGVISGTPTGGTSTFTVTATDASAAPGPYSGSGGYTVTIAAPTITLAPASLPNGTQGTAYSVTFSASGGTSPYAYAITAGSVPPGMSLSSGGTLSGTPSANGSFTFTVTARDNSTAPGPYSGARTYTVNIVPRVTVNAVTRLTPSPTATATVSYRVLFSGSVSGLTVSNFDLTTTGLSSAAVTSVSGSGTTYTVVVNTGTGDGTLRLDVANATGVTPTISNVPYTSGETYTITKTFAAAPTLRIQAAGSATNNGDVTAFVDVVQVLQSGTSTAVTNGVLNGSFETNNVDPSNFKKTGDGVVATNWNFTGLAGVARNNSAFGSTAADGTSVALIQSAGDNNASISQNLAVPTGSYQIQFQTIQRNYTSLDQRLNVFINDVFVGIIQPNNDPKYATFVSASFNVAAPALTATVSTPSASPTSTTPIPFAVTFSQSVGSTFTASDVTVSGGTLASGSFSGSGAGPYTFTVTPSGSGPVTVSLVANVANDANNTGNSASNTVSVQFQAPTITLSPTTLPNGTQGTAYSLTFSATGGSGTYTYAITAGALPAGMSLNLSTGTISGTPTANGTFNFTVTARDNSAAPGPYSGSRSYTLIINPQPVTAAPVVTAPANGSQTNNAQPTYSGTAPANSTVTVYVDNTSIGTTTANAAGSWALTQPTALSQGSHTVFATAQSSGQVVSPNSNTNTFTVDTVAPTVVLSSNTVANGGSTTTSPVLFTATFSEPVTGLTSTGISVSGGSVTSGPTVGSGNTYTFQVTPSGVGTVAVQVLANTVQDRAGNNSTNSSPYTFTFQSPTISLTPALLPNGTVGVAYSLVFTASGGTSPYTYAITAGALPTGMTLAGNGTLSGTPTAGGSFNFTVTATDNATSPGPYSGSRSYTFTINAPTVALLPNILPNGQQGTAYSVVFTASGGTSPYTYAISAGSLPAGLTLASNGTLSGIPTASGSFNITVTATDASTGAGPYSGSRGYTLTIAPQPVTAAPVVTAPANGALLNTATPTYTGTAPANSTVNVYVDDTSIGTTTATGGGTWSLAQPTALSQGNHQVRATAQSSGQAVSGNSNQNSFTVDTVAPTVVVASSAGASGSTTGTTPIPFAVTFSEPVTGFVAADLTVSGGTVANFAGSGTSYTFDVTPAADGLITVEVPANVAQDGVNNGNTASSVFSITYSRPVTATPVVVTPANGSVITATKPTYTGTATASASLTLVVDENTATSQTTTVNASGNWTLTQLSDLTPGAHTVQARAQLAGQAVSAYSAVNSFTVVVLPGVVTATPAGVSSSGATLGGEVTDAGAGTVSERGVVYVAGSGNPTTSDTRVIIGAGTGSFAQAVTNLSPSTTYSVRAYAINQAGTSYGTTQLVSTGNALAIGSVTPEAVCAGGTISVAYTNSSPGTTLMVYLNGPSTSNLLLTTLNASQASGTITASIPADRVAGQYSVYFSGGGASSGSVNVTVKAIPPAPSTTPVTVCQNTTPVSLATGVTAAQGASLNWYTAATGGTASATAPVPPTSTVGSTTYYVSQTINGCESDRAALTYTVNALPVATLINDGPLSCTKPSVTLTAGGNGSYRFSAGATQVGTSNIATISMSGTYSVTVTDGNGCSATTQTVVGSDQSNPQADLTNDGPLTCAKTMVTLTAAGNGSYQFSAGATPIGTSNQATVNTGGVYSVTVTAPNGCSATAQTTVEVNTTVAAPTLTASALSTENTPISVTASGCGGTINWTATGGSGTANGAVYTFTQPGNYVLTATCTVGSCTSPAAPSLTLQIRPGGFAISGVELVRCQLVDAGRGQYEVSLTPQYSGLSGSTVSFGITNELAVTTAPGPYTIRLYTDNPAITLTASQADQQASYRYSWLAACNNSQPAPNRAPVAQSIPDQVLVVGQPYQLDLTNYFTDPDGQVLTFTATGLPAGLQLSGSRISGSPTQAGTVTVNLTALDPGGLQAESSVVLRVDPAPVTPTPGVFSIAGVTGVRCETVTASERRLIFSPVYTGLTGEPISFGITNEVAPTSAPGPYSIRLYTDNPAITLTASQGSSQASYRYNWLEACASSSPTPPTGNRPPVVGTGLGNQTATAGQGYTLFIPAGTFTDPDNDVLQISVSGLPAGLSFSSALNAITGTPAQAGSSIVQVTATDPSGLSTSLSFVLTVQPATTSPTPGVFSIAGVTGVRCETVTASERRLIFSPVYTGLTGEPISFGITNEVAPTSAPGPYSIRLYTDNPAITLTATQGASAASYRYNWLAACATPANGRQAVAEAVSQLSVVVLGNPVVGESVEIVIGGVEGQAVELSLTDLAGNRLHQQQIRQAAGSERVTLPVSTRQAITILKVNTATQQQTVKLIRQ